MVYVLLYAKLKKNLAENKKVSIFHLTQIPDHRDSKLKHPIPISQQPNGLNTKTHIEIQAKEKIRFRNEKEKKTKIESRKICYLGGRIIKLTSCSIETQKW